MTNVTAYTQLERNQDDHNFQSRSAEINLYHIVILTAGKVFAYKLERKLYWSLIGAQKVKLYSLPETL